MTERHIPGRHKTRILPLGTEAETARRFVADRVSDARTVAQGEEADFILIKPADLDDLIEDAIATLAYVRTRDQESVPIELVDRLLAGENPIRVWREYRDLTLTALAEKSGISKSYLSQIEKGDRDGTTSTLAKIARVLAIDIDDLTTRPAPDEQN